MFDFHNYFKQIAVSHKQIAHTPEKPAFFREFSASKVMFNLSDFFTHQAEHARNILIYQSNDEGNLAGVNADTTFRTKIITLYLLRKVEYNNHEHIELANAELETIFDDIFSKMKRDRNNDLIPLTTKLNSFTVNSLGMIADSYFGLVINLRVDMPYSPKFFADRWI